MPAVTATPLRALPRLVAVLALVVGVLAMHGLTAGGHAGHTAAVAGAQDHLSAAVAGAQDHLLAAAAVPTAAAVPLAVSALDEGRQDRVDPAGLAVCLATLVAAAMLLRRAWRAGALVQPASAPRVPRPRVVPPGRGPPRLLLAQLCVLRT